MKLREAGEDDLQEVLRLYRQLQPDDPVIADNAARTVFLEIVESPWLAIYLLEEAGRVCASCYLNVIPNLTRSAQPYAVIENVITDEALRGRGVGKMLMNEVLAIVWERGCYKAMLQTGSKKESTHAYYRACGFSGDDKKGYVARPPR